MSPSQSHAQINGSGFPRVSGDEPADAIMVTNIRGFSPRERG